MLWIIVIMLAIAVRRNHVVTVALSLMANATAFALLFFVLHRVPAELSGLLIIDRYSLFYMGLVFAACFAVVLLAYNYLQRRSEQCEEFYVILLIATLGAVVLVASTHFISFVLGLEILSVSLYVLVGYHRTEERCIEASLKYLILAAASSAFLLFGMALIYAEFGTMQLSRMSSAAASAYPILVVTGAAMIIVGIGFKLAVVPFHMWTPDVYQGAPAPVSAFIATVSKGAMFALLMRYFYQLGLQRQPSLFVVFAITAVLSMFVGNLLALLQTNVKRLLAYSSIAHLGYLLVAFLAGGTYGPAAVTYYLVAYFVTTLSAFGVITVLSGAEREADLITDYRGLFWRRPMLSLGFAVALLSLAGIPLTAGFVGKFFVVVAGVGSTLWWLVIVLVINSAIGLFYYLRIVVAMYSDVPKDVTTTIPEPTLTGTVALTALTLLLALFGIFPALLIGSIESSVTSLIHF
jgi:NADH-quinone oxidoreductase subunit N